MEVTCGRAAASATVAKEYHVRQLEYGSKHGSFSSKPHAPVQTMSRLTFLYTPETLATILRIPAEYPSYYSTVWLMNKSCLMLRIANHLGVRWHLGSRPYAHGSR
jgi:hypothetical protein